MNHEPRKLAQLKKTRVQCPVCGKYMQKRNGKYGKFWGCIRYPNCTATLPDTPDKDPIPKVKLKPRDSPDLAFILKAVKAKYEYFIEDALGVVVHLNDWGPHNLIKIENAIRLAYRLWHGLAANVRFKHPVLIVDGPACVW